MWDKAHYWDRAHYWRANRCENLSSISHLIPHTTPSKSKIHWVDVGNGGHHTFDPDVTFADVGDIVAFTFFPTNHSVVRGEHALSSACGSDGCNPCVPFELILPTETGIHSQNILTQTTPTAGDVISSTSKTSITNETSGNHVQYHDHRFDSHLDLLHSNRLLSQWNGGCYQSR